MTQKIMTQKKTAAAKILRVIVILFCAALVMLTSAAVIFEVMISSPTGKKAAVPDDLRLILVNSEHSLPNIEAPELVTLSNGQRVAEIIYPDLQNMFDDMRAEGLSPYVREGYRTAADQKSIIRETIMDNVQAGRSVISAYKRTKMTVSSVGNSEHQLGLAVDINPYADRPNPWGVYTWLADNAYKYGFILRYPEDKTDITGISYEPWHYRYVGKEAALEIYTRGVCLEEYLAG